MTDATQADRLRGHAFDGIEEFDNRLPNWWLWTFYIACIFSVFYWIHFHVLGTGALPRERYRAAQEAEMQRLAAQEVSEESLRELAANPAAVAAGRQVFVENCATCHRADAGGMAGPNLTDAYWIHGGSPLAVYGTIVKGVPLKGMPDYWMRQLGALRCQQAAAYVLSLKNTNVPDGKAPEGSPEQ